MATYCGHEVRFRGRLLEITCRYNVPMSVEVKKGKPLPELVGQDLYHLRFPETEKERFGHKIYRALVRVMRRQGQLTADGTCDCRFD